MNATTTWRPRRVLAALAALLVLVGVALPAQADNPLGWRERTITGSSGYFTSWSGSVGPLSGGACAPGDVRCDHTLLTTAEFQGTFPCVGVVATGPGGRGLHIAAYRVFPGQGTGEAVATSYDGTLLFWGEPGAVYDIEIGKVSPTDPNGGFTAQAGTGDIGLGPGIGPDGDLLLCVPGLHAADSARELAGIAADAVPPAPPLPTIPPVSPPTIPPVTPPTVPPVSTTVPLPPVTTPPVTTPPVTVPPVTVPPVTVPPVTPPTLPPLPDPLTTGRDTLKGLPDPTPGLPTQGSWQQVDVSSYHLFGGVVPGFGGAGCAPLMITCDHTLARIVQFNGPWPCVGIQAFYADQPWGYDPAHVTVTKWKPGVGFSEVVATSDSGALLFWGAEGASYLVTIGEGGVPNMSNRPYLAAIGTLDIGFQCMPGGWVAETMYGRFFPS